MKKSNICYFLLFLSSLCFNVYTILISNKHLKSHPEVLLLPSSYCLQYCFEFMTNKIFQFVVYLQPTFKDLILQMSPHSKMKNPGKFSFRAFIDVSVHYSTPRWRNCCCCCSCSYCCSSCCCCLKTYLPPTHHYWHRHIDNIFIFLQRVTEQRVFIKISKNWAKVILKLLKFWKKLMDIIIIIICWLLCLFAILSWVSPFFTIFLYQP